MRFLKQLRLFSDISGWEDVKWTLQKVLESEEPIHILLVGPPGLGKTSFLKAIKEALWKEPLIIGTDRRMPTSANPTRKVGIPWWSCRVYCIQGVMVLTNERVVHQVRFYRCLRISLSNLRQLHIFVRFVWDMWKFRLISTEGIIHDVVGFSRCDG